MSDDTMSREDAGVAIEALMGGESPTAPVPIQPEPSGDELVEEMRGPVDGPNDAPASEEPTLEENPGLDTPGEILDKLRKAQQDAGKAGYKVGVERKRAEEAEARAQQLEQRLQALENGQTTAPEAQQAEIQMLDDARLDAFMAALDPRWSENREDPYMKQAAAYAASIAVAAVGTLRGEINGVAGGVQSMQFDQRLERLQISRPQFDAVWQDPDYSWGATLTDDQRLAALESQAGRLGRSPSQAGSPGPMSPSAPGAQPTSRVSPRTIETSQAPTASTQNPVRLRELELQQAIEKGDSRAASSAAAPLFERLMG
jgi:hypothetical protein